MELCRRLILDCFESEDYAEGRNAFMQKRKPVFQGQVTRMACIKEADRRWSFFRQRARTSATDPRRTFGSL